MRGKNWARRIKICKAFWGEASSKMEIPQSKCLVRRGILDAALPVPSTLRELEDYISAIR